KQVPSAYCCTRRLIHHVRFAEPPKGSCRCSILWIGPDLARFCLRQLFQISIHRAEAQLAVKPESAGFNRLFIVINDMVGIDRDSSSPMKLAQQTQHLCIDPGCFAIAIGKERIEAELCPLKE